MVAESTPGRDAPDAEADAPEPEALQESDVGKQVSLVKPRHCVWCGHTMNVARVVRLSPRGYSYACLGCALKTG